MQPSFLGSPLLSTARYGGGEEKNRNIRVELSAQTHGAFKRRDNHGHILFTAQPNLPLQNKGSQEAATKAQVTDKTRQGWPRLTARAAQGLQAVPRAGTSQLGVGCSQTHFPSATCLGTQLSLSAQKASQGGDSDSPKTFQPLGGGGRSIRLLTTTSFIQPMCFLVAWLGFFAAHSNEHPKLQTITQLQLPPHS